MPVSSRSDSQKVIKKTTSDEGRKASLDSIIYEKELQGLKTSTVIVVEKTWSEDEINNQNGMTL